MEWPTDYRVNNQLQFEEGFYALRPIHWSDRESIRIWRNANISHLRQEFPLSPADQDTYFSEVVKPEFDMLTPPQVLFGFLEHGQLCGYGGLVHISWPDKRAEVSFLLHEEGHDDDRDSERWRRFLTLLVKASRALGLHRLTTETYPQRPEALARELDFGFVQEGVLHHQYFWDGAWYDSIVCSYLLEDVASGESPTEDTSQ
jgi:RimJ/RimL family protein N-acetyltransferase